MNKWRQVQQTYLSVPPLGHIWHVMWRKGNINRTVPVLHYCVLLQWCIKVQTGRLTAWGFDLAWFSSVFQMSLCLQSACCCVCFLNVLHSLLYLLMSWAWWDWPLTWLTNHCPSVAVWLSGNVLASINVVVLHQTRLVPGWVTVCGRVNHLCM